MKIQSAKAGIGTGRAGLQAASGLFSSAGLFDKGVKSFNPLDLDPYLLFDAQTSMIGTLENPTLDLDPATPSTLDVITATRSSVATRTLPDGRIALAEQDTVRVDYTQGAELTPTKFQNIGYTDFTSSLWVKSNATVTFNQETAPDGTQTAAKYFGSGTGQDLYYNSTFTGPFTYSLFVKYINVPYIRLRNDSVSTWFNLTSGSVATQNHDSASIEDVGNGWFRISVTVSSSSSLLRAYIHPHATDNTTFEQDGGSFYLWGPQVEEGTTATDFVENTSGEKKFISSAVYGPRVPMILVEPSATNLVTYSEDFSDSSWLKTDVTVSAAPVAAPDGTMTATHVVSTGSNAHLVRLSVPSGTHTNSIWARTASGAGTCFFKPSGLGGVLTTVTDQWQRFDVPSNTHVYAVDFRGGSTLDEIYIWGAQLEAGSVATSYIPTSGGNAAARTRAADDLSILGSQFTNFFNSGGDGTFYAEFVPEEIETVNNIITGHGGGGGGLFIYSNYPTFANIRSYDGTQATSYGDANNNEINRASMSYNSSTFRGSLNGSAEDSQPHNGTFSTKNHLRLGYNIASPFRFKRVIYWPYSSENL